MLIKTKSIRFEQEMSVVNRANILAIIVLGIKVCDLVRIGINSYGYYMYNSKV